ncbi:MAG: Holliday junction resolvase RuvX [Candidatus Shapirobacteria bacterium]|jgi:putative Holliday junction resolvase
MNYLGIDFGTKRVGLAISVRGVISPLSSIKNDHNIFSFIQDYVDQYQIDSIYIGLSQGKIGKLTLKFIDRLHSVIKLPIETVEEAVSTIEANSVFVDNRRKKRDYSKDIDSLAAAVILRRVIS